MSGALERRSARLSIAQLALLVPWVAIVIDAWRPIGDSSFLWHVRAGSVQAEAGEVLTTDPFSFTMAGAEWLTQSWLVELFYAYGESLAGGLGFVPWMLLIVGTLTFVGIGLIAYRESRSVIATAFCLILSTLLLISFLVPRPVLFSFLLFVLVMLAWERKQTRWAVPFLFWLWAAAHGSFAVGLAYIGLRMVSERDWRRMPTALVSAALTLLTAHGLGVIEILLDFGAAQEALSFISEWRRPNLSDVSFIVFLGGLAIIGIGLVGGTGRLRSLWAIIPFAALGLSSIRAIPPAWIGLLPIVAFSLSGLTIGAKRRFSIVAASLFVFVVFVLPFFLRDVAGLDGNKFPVAASGALNRGPLFHDDRTGGYLIYAGGPERQVFIDDRAELYGDRLREFVEVRNGKAPWRPVFERDGIEQVLLEADAQLIAALRQSGWETKYEDENFALLVRGS